MYLVDDSRQALDPKERDLRLARRSLYYWNKLTETPPTKTPSPPPEEMITSRPILQRPATQDYVEATCIKDLLSSATDSRHLEGYAGTDRGLNMMHLTVPQSRQDLYAHINRYSALFGK
ncbi:hypothetical protein BGZ47_001900 [Haplosporangium gracile]|nr:hypothetical protein BGZ47_001900 [Haplosporangium gracile]